MRAGSPASAATAACNCRSRQRKRRRRGFFERDGEDADLTLLWKRRTFGAQQHVSAHTAPLKIASVVLSRHSSTVQTGCPISFHSFVLIRCNVCARCDFHSVASGRTWKHSAFQPQLIRASANTETRVSAEISRLRMSSDTSGSSFVVCVLGIQDCAADRRFPLICWVDQRCDTLADDEAWPPTWWQMKQHAITRERQ